MSDIFPNQPTTVITLLIETAKPHCSETFILQLAVLAGAYGSMRSVRLIGFEFIVLSTISL